MFAGERVDAVHGFLLPPCEWVSEGYNQGLRIITNRPKIQTNFIWEGVCVFVAGCAVQSFFLQVPWAVNTRLLRDLYTSLLRFFLARPLLGG